VQADLDRFLALVRRELGAEDARVLEAGAVEANDPPGPGPGDKELRCVLADGRSVAIRFAEAPPDREAKQRRLEMLASTFDTMVEDAAHGRRSRPPVQSTLHDELLALCVRAAAENAIVIDANSPIVWGAAHPEGVVMQPPLASSPRMAETPANDEGERGGGMAVASRRAVLGARALPEIAALRKGKHVRHVEREGDVHFLAHSFASIYLLVLVYEADFDEIRAERAVTDALPRVERLVMALPPLDPGPPFQGAGAAAIRPKRR
jgi:hypothetical protein